MRRPLALALGLIVAACSSGGSPAQTTTAPASESVAATVTPTVPATPAASRRPKCTNPTTRSDNTCLGPLPAGTYTTESLQPPLTYTVPAGWSNLEDLPGNFLLIPPGAYLAGVNSGTSDYLGVYSSVAAAGHCTGLPDPDVKPGFDAYIAWLKSKPGLAITNIQAVTVSGLKGTRMDIGMKPGGDKCPDGEYADVYVGLPPSDLVHGVIPTAPLRVWLLNYDPRIIAIEAQDAANGGSTYPDWWAAATDVVSKMVLAPS